MLGSRRRRLGGYGPRFVVAQAARAFSAPGDRASGDPEVRSTEDTAASTGFAEDAEAHAGHRLLANAVGALGRESEDAPGGLGLRPLGPDHPPLLEGGLAARGIEGEGAHR